MPTDGRGAPRAATSPVSASGRGPSRHRLLTPLIAVGMACAFFVLGLSSSAWLRTSAAAEKPVVLSASPRHHSGEGTGDLGQTMQPALVDQVKQQVVRVLNGPGGIKQFPTVADIAPTSRMRVLVTGGAGFVGSHLVDALMAQGHYVIVVDSLYTGRRENIEQWVGHPHFEFREHDVIDPISVRVDRIYHLACPASPPHYQADPVYTTKTSAIGTLNMLGLAKRTKARLLFTSTSEVYGDPLRHPQKEDYWGNVNPIGPRSCYDEGKRVAESLCYSYRQQGFADVRVVRIFNTFGPRMNPKDGRVVSNFITQALRNEPITIYGTGDQTRSFQYVSDLVRGLIAMMEGSYSETPVNLGNPDETTIRDFASKVLALVPATKSEVVFRPATKDDPARRKPDISLAGRVLGWRPTVTVDQGLQETLKYFQAEIGVLPASGSPGSAPTAR